jgi:molybdate transport system ATP-binding protein
VTGLLVDVGARRAGFELAAQLVVPRGGVLAVVGPNGSGKSTLLDVVAGRLRPDSGSVRVGDRVVTDVGRGVHVRPEKRSVGLLGQDALVFPHLSARENVAFGPRAAGVPAARARAEADERLAAVGLQGLEGRRPLQLSGGQRQRVAVARALAAEPEVLLLDEPFSQLDVRTAAELRDVVRSELRRTGTTAVLVTHDVLDAVALGDELAVLVDGVVVERGTPAEVLDRPRHPFSAALAGVNLVVGETVDGPHGPVLVAGAVCVPCPAGVATGTRAQATFPPSAVQVVEPGDERAAAVTWATRVLGLETGTTGVVLRTEGDVLVEVPSTLVASRRLGVGSPLELAVARDHVRVRAD